MVRPRPLTSRAWRRLERRAIAAHERDLLAALHHLARAATPIDAVEIDDIGVGVLRLGLAGQQLTVAGVAPATRRWLEQRAPNSAPSTLIDAGRYSGSWWLSLRSAPGSVTVLGARLRLAPNHGGGSAGPVGVPDLGPDGAQYPDVHRWFEQRQPA